MAWAGLVGEGRNKGPEWSSIGLAVWCARGPWKAKLPAFLLICVRKAPASLSHDLLRGCARGEQLHRKELNLR